MIDGGRETVINWLTKGCNSTLIEYHDPFLFTISFTKHGYRVNVSVVNSCCQIICGVQE